MDETTNVTLIVKAESLKAALAYMVVKVGRKMFYRFVSATEAGVIGQYTIQIVISTEGLPKSRAALAEWMVEDVAINPPYPNGSLLWFGTHEFEYSN